MNLLIQNLQIIHYSTSNTKEKKKSFLPFKGHQSDFTISQLEMQNGLDFPFV